MEDRIVRPNIAKSIKSNLVNTGAETFEFTAKAKKNLMIIMIVGVVLSIIGVMASMGGGHEEATGGHDATEVAATDHNAGPGESIEAGEHHGSPTWLKSIYSNLWINSMFFAGLSLLGVFFFTIQYAAQAGWSAGFKRVPEAISSY